jgi:hypothetical protein
MEEIKAYLEEQIKYYQELVDMGEGSHNSSDMIEFETYLSAYQNILDKL